ncbi:SubName: Full=Uncharacterized protein {ECO:0000313/EMBL:CCA71871.1} [Serendipita indica DSM 11827]|nr:SubName: Full=Uncharacterized protein {ECO:0000313/EMBL:CCA71871.1} [Serendipita indica DSM 11827]
MEQDAPLGDIQAPILDIKSFAKSIRAPTQPILPLKRRMSLDEHEAPEKNQGRVETAPFNQNILNLTDVEAAVAKKFSFQAQDGNRRLTLNSSAQKGLSNDSNPSLFAQDHSGILAKSFSRAFKSSSQTDFRVHPAKKVQEERNLSMSYQSRLGSLSDATTTLSVSLVNSGPQPFRATTGRAAPDTSKDTSRHDIEYDLADYTASPDLLLHPPQTTPDENVAHHGYSISEGEKAPIIHAMWEENDQDLDDDRMEVDVSLEMIARAHDNVPYGLAEYLQRNADIATTLEFRWKNATFEDWQAGQQDILQDMKSILGQAQTHLRHVFHHLLND